MIEAKIKAAVADIPDFPKPGIVFKDITPILLDPALCNEIVDAFLERVNFGVDAIVGIESRGFLFGPWMAHKMNVPFVPIRKKGKLPGNTVAHSYDLEYGSATIEIHDGVLKQGHKVLIHDDLIATGGTVAAAAELIEGQGAHVAGFNFLVGLTFLNGAEMIKGYSPNIVSLAEY